MLSFCVDVAPGPVIMLGIASHSMHTISGIASRSLHMCSTQLAAGAVQLSLISQARDMLSTELSSH